MGQGPAATAHPDAQLPEHFHNHDLHGVLSFCPLLGIDSMMISLTL